MAAPRGSIRFIIHPTMKRSAILMFFVFLGTLVLGACGELPSTPTLAALPTQTGTPIPSPTATIDWFPPTPTSTRMPTLAVTPTPEQRPGLGPVVLQESFHDPSLWSNGRTASGSIAVDSGALTLAVSAAKGALFTLRSGTLAGDAYVDVDVNVSLCRPGDLYGLLVRAASSQDFYRILVSCDGQMRVERAVGGQIAILQDWVYSSIVRPGAPFRYRLGVWMYRGELRVFANDEFQLSARDPVLKDGTLGLFARSGSDSALTVSFSNLQVRSLNAAQIP
jgi:hypothetical protein